MIVGVGDTVPDGRLPVYSCDTKAEADSLVVLTCCRNYEGEYVARELAEEQSLTNLLAFSDRLALNHKMMKAFKGGV